MNLMIPSLQGRYYEEDVADDAGVGDLAKEEAEDQEDEYHE